MYTDTPLAAWLGSRGGVAHTSQARGDGFSPYHVAAAVSNGSVIRVRRSWIALPGSDRALVGAASAGGRTTCLTEADRLGLWVPPETASGLHIAVAPTASRFPDGWDLRLHWARGPAPVPRHALSEPLLNVLFHAALCQPRESALAIWESALRTGQVTADVLRRVRWGSALARELAALASELSDSGLETIFVHRARPLGVAIRQQMWIDGHPLDVLLGECLAVQLDGYAFHSSPDNRRRDMRADARLALRGITVLRFDWHQVLFDWPYVEGVLTAALAQGLHLRSASTRR